MLWELLEVHKAPQAAILDTFLVLRDSKKPPGSPQVTIDVLELPGGGRVIRAGG